MRKRRHTGKQKNYRVTYAMVDTHLVKYITVSAKNVKDAYSTTKIQYEDCGEIISIVPEYNFS